MRAEVLTLLCALSGCGFEVNLGGEVEVDAGPLTMSPAVVCPPRAQWVAYQVTVDATPIEQSCWSDAGVEAMLPVETFEAFIVQGRTLGITGLSLQRLGEAPPITIGAAFSGSENEFEWTSEAAASGETIHSRAVFKFDRLDTRETAGTITLDSSSTGGRSCSAVRSFRATATDTSATLTLSTPELANAQRYLAVVDLGALSRANLTCTGPAPASRVLTPALRAIEVWQLAWPLARIPARSVALPGAPVVHVESDLGPLAQRTVSERDAGVDARETRTTSAELILPCMNEVNVGLELTSRYECSGAGCAALTADDAASCSVRIPYSVFAL